MTASMDTDACKAALEGGFCKKVKAQPSIAHSQVVEQIEMLTIISLFLLPDILRISGLSLR